MIQSTNESSLNQFIDSYQSIDTRRAALHFLKNTSISTLYHPMVIRNFSLCWSGTLSQTTLKFVIEVYTSKAKVVLSH